MTQRDAARLIDERCDAITGAIAALGSDATIAEVREAFMRAARADLAGPQRLHGPQEE